MEKIAKRGMVAVVLAVLVAILTASLVQAECKPLTGYPTIDAWILAGCRNEQQYYGNGYGNGYGNDGYGYNGGYSYQGGGTTSWGGSRYREVITIPVPLPPRWRR